MRISTCRICKTVAVIALFSLTFSLLSIFNFEHRTKQDTNSIQLALYKRNYGRQLSVESDKQVVVESVKFHRKTNGVADFGQYLKTRNKHVNDSYRLGRSVVRNENSDQNVMRKTVQSDIFISVKTTKSNRVNRLQLLMDTWISLAGDEVCTKLSLVFFKFLLPCIYMYSVYKNGCQTTRTISEDKSDRIIVL